ncbi:Wall-associated receptor kinase [Arachis hypogaea]|nr:Wall-associated receptor kinase [Arachis hypogaea]
MLIFVSKYCYNSSYGNNAVSSQPSGLISYSTGCLTRCYGNTKEIKDGDCSGIGCCEVDIPPKMRSVSTQAGHLGKLLHETFPVVFNWSVGNETCKESQNRGTNICKGNSICMDAESGYGYRCQCQKGLKEIHTFIIAQILMNVRRDNIHVQVNIIVAMKLDSTDAFVLTDNQEMDQQ